MPNSGLDVMIDLDKIDDLGRLYRLFAMVPAGIPTLRKAFRETIIRRGRDINSASLSLEGEDVQEDEDMEKSSKAKGKGKARAGNAGSQVLSLALKWVQDVLDMKDKFDKIWSGAFQSDRDIESSTNEVRGAHAHRSADVEDSGRHSRRSSICMRRRPSSSPCSSTTISRRVSKG